MARQVLPIVGAIVGGIYGGPQGAQIGFAIGSVVGNAVDPQRLAGPKIGEVPVQTSEEGVVCPLYAGTCAGPGNLIYKHLFPPVTVEEQQGKGGGPIIESERLYGTFAIRVGASLFDGPGTRNGIAGYVRIWEDEKLVYDVSPGSTILEESAAYAEGVTFYYGTETQLPDPDIEAIEGVGNVPAYRGRAYVVFHYKDLTDRRGSVPQLRFEVAVSASEFPNVPLVSDVRHYSGSKGDLQVASASMGWSAAVDVVRVSPDGIYAAGSDRGSTASGRFTIRKYDQESDSWSVLANPAYLPTHGPSAMAWSPDGLTLAILSQDASPEQLVLYRRSGDTFTKLATPAEPLPNSGGNGLAWDSVGQRLAVTNASSAAGVFVYDFVADTLVNRRGANTNGVGGTPARVDFMPGLGSRYLACGNASAVYVVRCEESPMTIAAGLGNDAAAGAYWDSSSGYLIGVDNATVSVYSFQSSVIGTESLTFLANSPDALPSSALDASMHNGRRFLAVATGQQYPSIYTWTETLPPAPLALAAPAASGAAISSVSWTDTPDIAQIESGTSSLPSVIQAIVKRVKQPASLVETSQVASEVVRGLVFGSQDYNATDALRSLAQTYLFDVSDYDGQLNFIPRGGAVQFSITEDDLVEAPGDSFVRANAIEQPGKISLFFQNPTIYYQPSKVNPPFIGYENGAVNEVSIQVPVVLNEADEAPQLVDKMQKINETDAQGEITRVVSDRFLRVVPAAVGAFTERGITRRVRVTGMEEYDYRVKLKMRIDRQSAVTSNLTVTPTPPPDPPPSSIVGQTTFAYLNIPAISDSDDRLGYRFAVAGVVSGWHGAALQRKSGADTDYSTVATKNTASVIGYLTSPITSASEHVTDYTNVVRIYFPNGETIDSLTYEQFLSEGGGLAIDNGDGTWELCQYQDAAEDSNGIVELSTLVRGRANTGATAHLAGRMVVMLNSTQFVEAESSLMGLTLQHRPVSIGASPETASVYLNEFDPAYSQVEMPVSQLSAERDGSDILTITWAERRRLGTVRNPIRSINWLGFRIEIDDGSTVVTLPDQTTDSVTYDASALSSPVDVRVYQINRLTGLGPASEVSV